eukprot:scaffold2765_cov328-Prasinococcus_capsulatus_cf.AAC.9
MRCQGLRPPHRAGPNEHRLRVPLATAALRGRYATLRLASGEERYILLKCRATVGMVGNLQHNKVRLGKAGASRWLGRRPHVRGVAMNPIDHPHGGGEGKTSGGRPSVTPWGRPTKVRAWRIDEPGIVVEPPVLALPPKGANGEGSLGVPADGALRWRVPLQGAKTRKRPHRTDIFIKERRKTLKTKQSARA